MPSSPRIFRAVPKGHVTRAGTPIPVVATMRWATGEVLAVRAQALAWTRDAVEVSWTPPGLPTRTDWISAADVRRTEGPVVDPPPVRGDLPRAPTRHRPRW